jgi:hypothetical protein
VLSGEGKTVRLTLSFFLLKTVFIKGTAMSETVQTAHIMEQIKDESAHFHALNVEISKIIVGQQCTVEFIVLAILCNGHILLEGVPGVAKTTIIIAFNLRPTYCLPILLEH